MNGYDLGLYLLWADVISIWLCLIGIIIVGVESNIKKTITEKKYNLMKKFWYLPIGLTIIIVVLALYLGIIRNHSTNILGALGELYFVAFVLLFYDTLPILFSYFYMKSYKESLKQQNKKDEE